ncbi:MAG: DUF61 family protein [Thermoplasmata archaeon]
MRYEARGVHQGLVVRKRSLKELLPQEKPICLTREGEDYGFDRESLERFAAVTIEQEREKLRLPITALF